MPELRKDPVVGRWVIIAAERAQRPSDFLRASSPRVESFCPFCPGNESATPREVLAHRQGGVGNGPGWTLRVVPNSYPALRIEGSLVREGEGLFDRMSGIGAHEVIIESPRHDRTLADFSDQELAELLGAWRERIVDLRRDSRFRTISIFKNHGEAAGATLSHPHSQLIALPIVPLRLREELEGCLRHYSDRERCIYCDIMRQERRDRVRVVYESEQALVLAPWASRSPFETWILPKTHASNFEDASPGDLLGTARALRAVLRKLDAALERPAFNFMLHTAPLQERGLPHYHWHIEILPSLTKAAGFEWGTGFHINPTPPEEAAEFLRRLDP